MKKYVKVFVCVLLLLSVAFSITVNADTDAQTVTVSVNDKIVEFDVAPVIEDGRTLVPIKAVSEELKYEVTWYGETNRVVIKNNDDTLELFIGKKQYLKNGIEKQMDVPATITDGRTLVPLRLVAEEFGCTVRWLPDQYKAEIVKYETVTVASARELLEAIGSHKRIILAEGEYNLSKVEEKPSSDFVGEIEWEDGREYIVYSVKDLIIEGEKGKNVSVIVEPRCADVLSFTKCDYLTLKNLTMGHSIEPGYCTGGVVSFGTCAYVELDDLHLYGCGTEGIIANNCMSINVKNTEIYECTYGLMDIMYCYDVSFDNCIFRDTGKYDMFYIENCKNIKVSDSVIKNNLSDRYSVLIGVYDSENVSFENCDFNENAYYRFTNDGVVFENCRNNNYPID